VSSNRYLFLDASRRRRRRAKIEVSRTLHWAQILALTITAALGVLLLVGVVLSLL